MAQHVAVTCLSLDPGPDMNRKTRHVVVLNQDLARVKSSPRLGSQRVGAVTDRDSALDSTRWPVESRKRPVASGTDKPPAVPIHLSRHHRVVALEEISPTSVP